MDIKVNIFMVPDESLELLELLHGEGHAILYMERWQEWARVAPTEPLPKKLGSVLRKASKVDVNYVYAVVDDRDPGETDPHKLIPYAISAQLGALADNILYKSLVSVRSSDAPTLAAMKQAKKWLTGISKAGVLEFALPKGRRDPEKSIRYTEGARRAFEAGVELRQAGVPHIGYAIP